MSNFWTVRYLKTESEPFSTHPYLSASATAMQLDTSRQRLTHIKQAQVTSVIYNANYTAAVCICLINLCMQCTDVLFTMCLHLQIETYMEYPYMLHIRCYLQMRWTLSQRLGPKQLFLLNFTGTNGLGENFKFFCTTRPQYQ